MRRSISYVVWKPKTIRQSFVACLRAIMLRRKEKFFRSRLPASLFDGPGFSPTDAKETSTSVHRVVLPGRAVRWWRRSVRGSSRRLPAAQQDRREIPPEMLAAPESLEKAHAKSPMMCDGPPSVGGDLLAVGREKNAPRMAVFILLEVSAYSRLSTLLATRRRDSPATSRRWQDTNQDSTLGRGLPPGLSECANAGTTDAKGLTPLRRPCSDASVGHRICVIAKGLGCLQWPAHATEDGLFMSASISLRTFSSVRVVCRRYLDENLVVMTSRTQLSSLSVHQSCSHALRGDLWKGQFRHHCWK